MNILETVWDAITDAKDCIICYFTEDTTITRQKIFTVGAVCTLIGIIAGFLVSPIKKGIYINISNNGNNGASSDDED